MITCEFSQAFEQARRDVGHVFVKRGDVDIEKIKQSKYFRSFLQKSIGSDAGQLVCDFVFLIFIYIRTDTGNCLYLSESF